MSKSAIIILGLAAVCAKPAALQAQTRGGFEIGLEAFDYGYRERLEGATVARDDGRFGGFNLGYVQRLGGSWFLRGRFGFALGSVDYRSDDGDIDDVSQTIAHLELHAGRDFRLGESGTTISPFIGLGGRRLHDHSGGEETEDGFLGYDREVTYSYVPVGVAADIALSGRTALVVSGQYNWVVGGRSISRFSDIDPEFPDVKLDFEGGDGFELGAAVRIPVGGNSLSVGPFVRRWSVDASETLTLTNPDDPSETIEFFEPASRTTEIGLRLSFNF